MKAARQTSRKRRACGALGLHHNLQAIFNGLNRRYFKGKIQARIVWSRRPRLHRIRARQGIKFGYYVVQDRLMVIHYALDRAWVPWFFVAYIVFHEMLHAKHRPRRIKGRYLFHPRELQTEEKTFAYYRQAMAWEERNLDRLLRY